MVQTASPARRERRTDRPLVSSPDLGSTPNGLGSAVGQTAFTGHVPFAQTEHHVSTTSTRRRIAVKDDEVVTPLELFFDLVFVYALTQVTALLAAT